MLDSQGSGLDVPEPRDKNSEELAQGPQTLRTTDRTQEIEADGQGATQIR